MDDRYPSREANEIEKSSTPLLTGGKGRVRSVDQRSGLDVWVRSGTEIHKDKGFASLLFATQVASPNS